jgi:quercetin dioxygenase-like cupin family protein
MIRKLLLGLIVAAVAGTAMAQQAGLKRTPLQKLDFPEGYNTVTVMAELAVGASAGRHTHPGAETGYVLDGEAEFAVEGQPSFRMKPGDSYAIPAGAVHDAKTIGDKPFKFIGIYIVDKTKPLATPAP